MNKIVSGLLLLCLIIIAGCTPENFQVPEVPASEGDEVMVRFEAAIPEFNTVKTRANGGVNDMYLLVFDENGNFIVLNKAILINQTVTGGTFTASLPSSSSPRIVHFVSNLEEDAFIDSPGSNEATVVALLNTSSATFWSRVELPTGISESSFTNTTVQLLRNQAKISVTSEAENFTYSGFTIHNVLNKGTVAPYSLANGFTERTITEPSGATLVSAQLADISEGEKYLFERKNANATHITTVIVQGTYDGAVYYYKIDLIDGEKNRYDIERNYHYMVNIKTVTREGYSNFNDALEGASHNNTALDPVIEKYPIISDGISKLEVEKTLIILTKPNEAFQVWVKYFPEINSDIVNNSGISVTLQAGNEAILSTSLQFNSTTGIISGVGLGVLPDEPGEAIIRVSKGELARTIRVQLREPFSFDPVLINDTNPGLVINGQSQQAILRFNIPDEFPDDLFPLPIEIHTQGLYPSTTGLEMVVKGGMIHYIYRATQKGEQTVYFKTNKSNNAETVTLKADYFTDREIDYETYIAFQGDITYGNNNANVPNNATVSASIGSITIAPTGTYKYTPPTNYDDSTPVILTYDFQIRSNNNGSFHERYTISTTIGNLRNNHAINLVFKESVVRGVVQYYTGGIFSNWTSVPNGSTLTVSGVTDATAVMTSEGRYEMILPGVSTGNTQITMSYYRSQNNTTYSTPITIDNLRGNGTNDRRYRLTN